MKRGWRILRRLSWRERLLLARSVLLLPSVSWLLHQRGLQGAQRVLAARLPSPQPDVIWNVDGVRRTAWAVDVAARRGLWRANCLERSLTLWYVLGRAGITSDLRIGVRREAASGAPSFHAWLELDGAVLNDASDIAQRFAAFDRAIAPPPGAAFD